MLSKPIEFISKESDMNYAHIKTKTAWLWTEFGESYASRVFPAEVLADRHPNDPSCQSIECHVCGGEGEVEVNNGNN